MSRYFVLFEPTLGESFENPGALGRITDDGGDISVMDDKDHWRSTPSMIRYFAGGEGGMQLVTQERARELIDAFPWPGSRFPRAPEAKDFDPSKHPRGGDATNPGRFSQAPGGDTSLDAEGALTVVQAEGRIKDALNVGEATRPQHGSLRTMNRDAVVDLSKIHPPLAPIVADQVERFAAEFPHAAARMPGVVVDGAPGRYLGHYDKLDGGVHLNERVYGAIDRDRAERLPAWGAGRERRLDAYAKDQEELNAPRSYHPLDDFRSVVDHELGHAVYDYAKDRVMRETGTMTGEGFTRSLLGLQPRYAEDAEKIPVRQITAAMRAYGSEYGARSFTKADRFLGSSLGPVRDLNEGFADWFSTRQRGLDDRTPPILQDAFEKILDLARLGPGESKADFDESQHPRDERGRFSESAGSVIDTLARGEIVGSGDTAELLDLVRAEERVRAVLPHALVDLSKLDPRLLGTAADAVEKFGLQFPAVAPYVGSLRIGSGAGIGRDLGIYSRVNGIVLSELYFGDNRTSYATKGDQEELNAPRSYHPLDDFRSVLDHELGHAVYARAFDQAKKDDPDILYNERFTRSLMGLKAREFADPSPAPGETVGDLRVRAITGAMRAYGSEYGARSFTARVGGYPSRSLNEGFADWFSTYQRGLDGRTPDILQEPFMKIVELAKR